ncbi:MAG: tetratricopeptide repeat protein [Candidatus Latescibacterota bacterium]
MFIGITTPDHAQVQTQDPQFLRAQVLESQGKLVEARPLYEDLFEKQPNDLYFWKLILIYERLGDHKGLERLALHRLKEIPGDLSAINYLSRAYHGQGDQIKARQVLLGSIGDRWSDGDRVRNAANEFQFRNDLDGALEIFRLAREKTGDANAYSIDIARLSTAQMKYTSAVAEYLRTLEESPVSYPSIEYIIRNSPGAKIQLPEFVAPLANYLRANPKSVKAAKLLADVQTRLGDHAGALRTIIDAAVRAGAPQEVWTFAEQSASEGRRDEALQAYTEYHRRFPADPIARIALLKAASIRMDKGDREGAKRDYSALASDYAKTPEAQLAALRLIQLTEGEGIDLTAKLRSFADSTVDRAVAFEAQLLLGDRYLRRGNGEEAGRALSQAVLKAQTKKEIYDVMSKSALLHFFTGNYDAMARDIESSVASIPDGEDSNDLLALRVLSLRLISESDRMNLGVYARGRFALYRGDEKTGLDSLMTVTADTSSVVASAAALSLGEHFRGKGETGQALEWYNRAIAAARDTTVRVEAMMEAADIQSRELGNPDAARKLYVDALTVYPGTVFEAELRSRLRRIVEK